MKNNKNYIISLIKPDIVKIIVTVIIFLAPLIYGFYNTEKITHEDLVPDHLLEYGIPMITPGIVDYGFPLTSISHTMLSGPVNASWSMMAINLLLCYLISLLIVLSYRKISKR